MKKTLLIKIVILAAVAMLWVESTVHLYAAVFAHGPLIPWIIINILAAVYMSLVAWATDSNGKEKAYEITRITSGIKKEHGSHE